MKTVLVSALLLGAFSAHGEELTCPAGSKTIMTCTEATQVGDEMIAVKFMQGAVVCEQDRQPLEMRLLLDGEISPSVQVKTVTYMGTTAYLASEGTNSFSLSRRVVDQGVEANGNFAISFDAAGGLRAERSLKCD